MKEFVGHMYSQQILSQVWYGRLENWPEKSLPSKVFHILVLLIMVPVNVIKKMFCKPVSSSPHVFIQKKMSCFMTASKFTYNITGKSLSEALILESTNPQYDKRLFIDLPVQYMKSTSSEHCSECQNKNNLCTHHVLIL